MDASSDTPSTPGRPETDGSLKNRRRSGPHRAVSLLAGLLLGLALLVSVPLAAGRAVKRLVSALQHGRETPAAAKERVLGPAYARSIAALRATIPEGAAYALVEGGDPAEGGALWVRYDLAPRKALDLGRLASLPAGAELERKLPLDCAWVVISNGRAQAPTLLSRAELLRRTAGQALAP